MRNKEIECASVPHCSPPKVCVRQLWGLCFLTKKKGFRQGKCMGFLRSFFSFENVACDGGGITGQLSVDKARKEFEEKFGMTGRNSFLDHLTNKYVTPEVGSVVLCDLSPVPCLSAIGLNAEHTGIYVGNNEIIHRNGDGYLEKVSPNKFLERLNGKNCAISVYISCKGSNPLNNEKVYNRAICALNDLEHSGYDITRYCLTGETDHCGLDFTFSSLQNLLNKDFGMDNWRIWNYN